MTLLLKVTTLSLMCSRFFLLPILLTWNKKIEKRRMISISTEKNPLIHLLPYWFLLGEGEVTVGSGLVDRDGAAL